MAQFFARNPDLIKTALRAASVFLLPVPDRLLSSASRYKIRVDENIQVAAEWKNAFHGATDRKFINEALTEHYLKTFHINRTAFQKTYLNFGH